MAGPFAMSLKHVSDEEAENICPHNAQGQSLKHVLLNVWNKKKTIDGRELCNFEVCKISRSINNSAQKKTHQRDYLCGLTYTQLVQNSFNPVRTSDIGRGEGQFTHAMFYSYFCNFEMLVTENGNHSTPSSR
jgi:hypothetical protein